MLANARLTDAGMKLTMGKTLVNNLSLIGKFEVSINPSVNIGLINISI